MALRKCSECNREISSDANPCPLCGKKEPHGTSAIVKVGGGFLALVGAVVGIGAAVAPTQGVNGMVAEAAMDDVERTVANDTVAEYEIAKRGGDAMDICVHAGLAAAAFLGAKDEAGYNQWKAVEKSDCAKAGVPQ